MADLIIRGMELPDRRTAELMHTELACVSRECDRHCENCDLVQDRDELIVAFREAIRVLEAVANAVPLPEGHGRLIDADALREDWLENGENEHVYDTNAMLYSIDNSPTIVPAEGGGEDG